MNDYSESWETLVNALGGSAVEPKVALTLDQKLKVAEIKALLSISQEISSFNPSNTTSYDEDGNELNGWGMIVERKPKGGTFWGGGPNE